MGVQRSLWDSDYISFWCILRSRLVGSYDRSIFNFWGLSITVFHNGCTNLYSHQQCIGVPVSPHHCQYLLSFDILIITVLTGMRWYLIVILIFVIDELLMLIAFSCACWLFVFILWKIFIHILCPFLIRFYFCYWVWVPYIFLVLTPYQIYGLQIFSPIL